MRAVLSRSVRNPLVVGLGAGVVLITTGAPAAVAATASPSPKPKASSPRATPTSAKATVTPPSTGKPSPSPSDTTTTPSPKPVATLRVGVTRLTSGTIHAGDVVKMNAAVTAGGNTTAADIYLSIGVDHGATVTPNCTESAGRCIVGNLHHGHSQSVAFTVSVPSGVTGKVTISAASWADNVSQVSGGDSFTVAAPPKTTNTTKSTNTNTNTGTSNNVNNTTGVNTGTAPNANLTPNNNTTGQAPSTTPVLPNVNSDPQTAAMNPAANKATMKAAPASADQLTFSRLASTQAAFLMALLVAFGLLMTQLKLGRAPVRATKPRGTHRRHVYLLRRRSR